jgi:hypothetical protein
LSSYAFVVHYTRYFTMAGIESASVGYNIMSRFAAPSGLLPLTTTFTYASSCTDRFLQIYPDVTTIFYSSYFNDEESSISFGNNYISCQAGKTRPTYSPGICPSGHTIATVTEYQTTPGAQESRLWEAGCCSRYYHPILLPSWESKA